MAQDYNTDNLEVIDLSVKLLDVVVCSYTV